MKRKSRPAQRGLTLVELIITLAVLAAVVAVSIPAFARLQDNYRLRSGAYRLLTAIKSAREQAVQRVQTVSLCPSSDGQECGGSYRDGWVLFVDTDSNEAYVPGRDELVLQAHGLPAGYLVVSGRGPEPAARSISYRSDGTVTRNQTLMVCAPAGHRVAPYSIVLSLAGRARAVRGEGQCTGV